MQLLDVRETPAAPEHFLAGAGEIFAVFDEHTQDSGNVSYGVAVGARRFFVKTAGFPANKAHLSHDQRVFWLRNAVRLSRALVHPSLCRLRNVVESAHGPMLVYDWASGELLGTPAERRGDPSSAFVRFKHLPLPVLTSALTTVFQAHAALCAHGWLASDFYDSAMMYDFGRHEITLVDLDMYREGPFVNDIGRMFGSTRFMAPEEFTLGARIDESTTVFTMGRCISVFLAEHLERDGSALDAIRSVAERACRVERESRWPSMRAFVDEWMRAVAATETLQMRPMTLTQARLDA